MGLLSWFIPSKSTASGWGLVGHCHAELHDITPSLESGSQTAPAGLIFCPCVASESSAQINMQKICCIIGILLLFNFFILMNIPHHLISFHWIYPKKQYIIAVQLLFSYELFSASHFISLNFPKEAVTLTYVVEFFQTCNKLETAIHTAKQLEFAINSFQADVADLIAQLRAC